MNRRPKQRLFVVGDSHALYCYAGIQGAKIYWLGPITMHRVGRDGIDSVLPHRLVKKLRSGDYVIFSFGEIDCRNHVERVAETENTNWQAVTDRLVARFLRTIAAFSAERGVIAGIGCVVPPSGAAALTSLSAQSRIRKYLNSKLASAAYEGDLRFIDFYDEYSDHGGSLKYPDSHLVHIDPQRTDRVAAAVNRTLGTEFGYMPIERDIFLYDTVPPRRLPKWIFRPARDTIHRAMNRSAQFISATRPGPVFDDYLGKSAPLHYRLTACQYARAASRRSLYNRPGFDGGSILSAIDNRGVSLGFAAITRAIIGQRRSSRISRVRASRMDAPRLSNRLSSMARPIASIAPSGPLISIGRKLSAGNQRARSGGPETIGKA